MQSQEATKRFVAFQGFALCVRVCRALSRERALGYSPPPTSAPAWWQAEKPQIQKAAVGGKKSPACAGTKKNTLLSICRRHIVGITQAAVFLPPKADFLNGHRPLFEPCRLLSSCEAWRWGVVATIRRKTRFPTGVADNPQKAKPTTTAMAFCVYINLYYGLQQVTPSANRNSFRVALICSELHPG